MRKFGGWLTALLLVVLMLPPLARSQTVSDSQFFPETNHTIKGIFLQYWTTNGGLPVYGYPLTDARMEVDPETGKTFLTQWFERNRFELHPENAGTPYEVLLGLLGKQLKAEALSSDPDFVPAKTLVNPVLPLDRQWFFTETNHNLRLGFLDYWQQNGGLSRFGYPISEEFYAVDPETGQTFLTQWFERARFEYHPENKPPYNVLLGLLGKQISLRDNHLWAEQVTKIGQSIPNLIRPRVIALDQKGVVYVANGRYGQIYHYTTTGDYLGIWLELDRPEFSGMAVDNQSNVYLSDPLSRSILKYDPYGKLLATFQFPGMIAPTQIKIDKNGNFYFIDNNYILKYSASGRLLAKFGGPAPLQTDPSSPKAGSFPVMKDGTFGLPSGIAIDAQGNIYVSDNLLPQIQKFDANGKFLLRFDRPTTGGTSETMYFAPLSGLDIDSQGNIIIVETIRSKITKFDSNGHFLSAIFAEGRNSEALSEPAGIQIDTQDNMYVLNQGSVAKLDNSGKLITVMGKSRQANDQFFEPFGVAVDGQSNLYVTDTANNRVQKFDHLGNYAGRIGTLSKGDGGLVLVESLAADRNGKLYFADQETSSIQVFDSEGHFLFRIPIPGGFLKSVGVDQSGNIFAVTLHTVYKFDQAGKFLFSFGQQGEGPVQFQAIVAIAINGQGNIYISDYGKSSIYKFTPTGQFIDYIALAGDKEGQVRLPAGLAVDDQGNLYVADKGNNRVQVFDPDGKFLLVFGGYKNGFGQADGQFSGPSGVAVDTGGVVWVADTFNNRVEKFRLHGLNTGSGS